MKFLSLEVRGFGNLAPGRYEFSDRTLVCAGNAAGKTTLAAALRAALYGLQADRRRQAITDQEAYAPWALLPYGLTLTVEAAGELLTIERDFERATGTAGATGLTVRNAAGEEITGQFASRKGAADAVGRKLVGVGALEFDRAVLAADGAWGGWSRETGGLVDLLGRVVATEKGSGTAAAALEACDEALRSYEGELLKGAGKVETEIDRASKRLREIEAALAETETRHAAVLEALSELERMRAEESVLEARTVAIRIARTRAQIAETKRAIAARRAAETEMAAARERRAELAHLAGFPAGRDREIAMLADKVAQGRKQAHLQEERIAEQIGPRLERVERELRDLGPVPDALDLAELATRVGALVTREGTASALRQERGTILRALEAEGVDLPEIGLVHAGLARLAETERQFLRDQERAGFGESDQESRLALDEKSIQAEVAQWRAQAARAIRSRNLLAAAAIVGVVLAAVTPLLPVPPAALAGGGAALLLIAGALAFVNHNRAAGLNRRCRLQSEDRLANIARARQEAASRRASRQARLAELGPAMLGAAKAAELAATPEDLLALYRRYDAFRNRHDGWFRTADRIAEEESGLAAAKGALRSCLEGGPGAAGLPADAAAIPAARFQAELERRGRIAELRTDEVHARELKDAAQREARRATEQVEEASRQAADILSSLTAGCRWQPVTAAGDAVPAAAGDDLAAAFAHQPRAAEQWFREREGEARELARLDAEVLPSLGRRLADHRSREDLERALTALGQELGILQADAAARAAGGNGNGDGDRAREPLPEAAMGSPAELAAAADELTRRRDALAREVAARARGLAEVERERRTNLPKLWGERDRLRGHLERAFQFRDAVTLARELIDRLGGEVYHLWSSHLNPDAGRLIARLCPEVAGITFTPDLDYRITLAGGRTLTSAEAERQLSSGVRDQIVLGIRLALARFLARPGEPLPLVLDDPFAHYDDGRFRRGMETLPEEAGGHQIILLTCQQERLRWLGQVAPEAMASWSRLALG